MPTKELYDLHKDLTFSLALDRRGKQFIFDVTLTPIPDHELIAYESSNRRTLRTAADGGMITETADSYGAEVQLFDDHFQSVRGPRIPSGTNPLTIIPPSIKHAAIVVGFGGVEVVEDTGEQLKEFDITQLLDSRVVIRHVANGENYELVHDMLEPTAEDELIYRRATSKMKALAGQRRPVFSPLEQFSVYPGLYKKLARSTMGYGRNGQPLEHTDGWQDVIPYFHKKVVIRTLMGSVSADNSRSVAEGEE